MNEKMNWRALRDYKCPQEACGTLLKAFKSHYPGAEAVHECPKCGYRIRNETLGNILKKMTGPRYR